MMGPVGGVVRLSLPGGSVALIDPDRLHLHVFNYTAHLLWRVLCRAGRSSLPAVLTSRFGLSPTEAKRDADLIWTQWQALGLVAGHERVAEPPPPQKRRALDGPSARTRVRIGPLLVDLRAPSEIAALLFPIWRHRRDESPGPDVVCVVETAADGLGRLTIDGRIMLDAVEPHVLVGGFYQALLERLHPPAQFCAVMHAGAVAAGDRAMIVAAPSGSGKSTLIAYLVTRGYTYLSDDISPLRAQDHTVVPFPLPISVKPGAVAVLKPLHPALQAVDLGKPPQYLPQDVDFHSPPRPARMLLFPRYSAGAPTSFEEIGVAEAFSRLLEDRIFFGYPIPPNMVANFLAWLRGVERRVLVYSDFVDAERRIAGVLRA